jgi:hypothetical protein
MAERTHGSWDKHLEVRATHGDLGGNMKGRVAHSLASAPPAAMSGVVQDEYMVHYDLDRMGWQQFEHMVQALALAELGNGVRSFGSGRDGGREATFRGKVEFPRGGGEQWDGYGVIQAKHIERPRSTTEGWRQFLAQVKAELDKWVRKLPADGQFDASRWPRYFIFATNVTLTGTESSGGIDTFDALLASYQERLRLKGWFAWDYSQLRALLDTHPSVRRTYLEQIVVGDFLANLETLIPGAPAEAAHALALHAAKELTSKQWVRIGDAGYGNGSKLPLSEIGIDLPGRRAAQEGQGAPTTVAIGATVIEAADAVCRPEDGGARGAVIVGGPGQGKSTLAQLIAHAYRVAFLEEADPLTLSPRAGEAIDKMRQRLRTAEFPAPARRRFPIVIDLSQFGAYLARGEGVRSLLGFVGAGIVTAGSSLDPTALLDWLKSWPCCLILDGLDEVPDSRARAGLMRAISDFVIEASNSSVDLFVVATTRPQGYRGEFEEALHTATFHLVPFTEEAALSYAEALITARSGDDPEQGEQVMERLFYAVHQRMTQRLMTTPLQVTIMAALAERAVDLPTTRFELFDAYYSTIYDREVGKSDGFRRLRKLRSHVDFIHEQAGLVLQKRAESGAGSDSLLAHNEVARLLNKRLVRSGFDRAESLTTTDELLRLAAERLVLLVSPHGRSYGFEVRSIQEYMAARALTEGTDDDILARLRVILPSAHWRNVWLLAAGRLLQTREHLLEAVIDLLVAVDGRDAASRLTLSGATLAMDLYLDDMASEFPAIRLTILERALHRLEDTSDGIGLELSSVIGLAQQEGPAYEVKAYQSLKTIAAQSTSNDAMRVLSQYRFQRDGIGAISARVLVGGRNYSKPKERGIEHRAYVLATYLLSSSEAETRAFAERMLALTRADSPTDFSNQVPSLREATVSTALYKDLDDVAVRASLVSAIGALRIREPDVAHFAVQLLRIHESRLPKAHLLDELNG